jgi:hypothetical protein
MTEALRTKLPNRRPAVIRRMVFVPPGPTAQPQRVYVCAGYLMVPDAAPTVREVFLRGHGRVGSEFDFLLDDVAVLLSRLLQADLAPISVREHLGAAHSNGKPLTIVAAVADELVAIQRDLVAAWKRMTPEQRAAFPVHYREPELVEAA